MTDAKSPQDPRSTFEALQALTTLCLLGDHVRTHITSTCFPSLSAHLSSSHSPTRQATTECLSNLTQSPSATSKFIATSPQNGDTDARSTPDEKSTSTITPTTSAPAPSPSSSNSETSHPNPLLHQITTLTKDPSRGTRLASTVILINITASAAGTRAFLSLPHALEDICAALSARTSASGKSDVDMQMRVLSLLRNLLEFEGEGEGEGGEAGRVKRRVRGCGGVEGLREMEREGGEVRELAEEVLGMVG